MTASRERNLRALLLLAQLGLALLPVWLLAFPLTQDGPSHLENAAVLLKYGHEASHFRAFYELNVAGGTNWLGHLILAGLLSLMTPFSAERLFLTGCLLGLGLTLWLSQRVLGGTGWWAPIAAIPLASGFVFYKGFYNFCVGLPLAVAIITIWLKTHHAAVSVRRLCLLAGLSLLLYVAHIVVWLMTAVAALVLTAWDIALELRQTPRSLGRQFRSRVPSLSATLAPALLAATFLVDRTHHPALLDLTLTRSVTGLLTARMFAVISGYEIQAYAGLALLCYVMAGAALLARRTRGRLERTDGLLLVAAVFAAACVLAPRELAGGSYVRERLGLLPFLALLIWLGAQTPSRRLAGVSATVAVALMTVIGGLRWHVLRSFETQVADVMTVSSRVEPRRSLLPVFYAAKPGRRAGPPHSRHNYLVHVASYVSLEKELLNLGNYEADDDSFPLKFSHRLDTRRAGVRLFAGAPTISIPDFESRMSGPVDYVLVIAEDGKPRDTFSAGMRDQYHLVYTSPQHIAYLYERRAASGRPLARDASGVPE